MINPGSVWLPSLYHTIFIFIFLDACLWSDELQRTAKVQRLRILYHDRMGGVRAFGRTLI